MKKKKLISLEDISLKKKQFIDSEVALLLSTISSLSIRSISWKSRISFVLFSSSFLDKLFEGAGA